MPKCCASPSSASAWAVVIADPYTRLLYSSTPEEVAAIQQLQQQGLSQDEAIRHLVQARRNRS